MKLNFCIISIICAIGILAINQTLNAQSLEESIEKKKTLLKDKFEILKDKIDKAISEEDEQKQIPFEEKKKVDEADSTNSTNSTTNTTQFFDDQKYRECLQDTSKTYIECQEFNPRNSASNVTSKASENPETNYLAYQNPKVGLSMTYPGNWQKTETPFSDLEVVNHLVSFVAPEQSESRFLVSIYSEDLPANIPLKDYVRDEYNELKSQDRSELDEIDREYLTIFKLDEFFQTSQGSKLAGLDWHDKTLGGGGKTILNNSQIKVNNIDGWKIDSTSVMGMVSESDIYFLGNDKAFIVTYLGDTDLYDKYSPVVQKMLDSVALK